MPNEFLELGPTRCAPRPASTPLHHARVVRPDQLDPTRARLHVGQRPARHEREAAVGARRDSHVLESACEPDLVTIWVSAVNGVPAFDAIALCTLPSATQTYMMRSALAATELKWTMPMVAVSSKWSGDVEQVAVGPDDCAADQVAGDLPSHDSAKLPLTAVPRDGTSVVLGREPDLTRDGQRRLVERTHSIENGPSPHLAGAGSSPFHTAIVVAPRSPPPQTHGRDLG